MPLPVPLVGLSQLMNRLIANDPLRLLTTLPGWLPGWRPRRCSFRRVVVLLGPIIYQQGDKQNAVREEELEITGSGMMRDIWLFKAKINS